MTDMRSIPQGLQLHMNDRVTRLEAAAEHIRADVASIKQHMRDMRGEFKELRDDFALLRKEFASLKVWALLLYMASVGGILGVLARGFKWI